MAQRHRVILIGGASHAGKSTFARELALRLGWDCVSTDSLARHPGRPWRAPPDVVPDHVRAHYLDLSVDALMASVLAHYRSMLPMITGLVQSYVEDTAKRGLVLEGSALLPESVLSLTTPQVRAVWLIADEALLRTRIHVDSGFAEANPQGQAMIDNFLARALAFNRRMIEDVGRLGLPSLAVDGTTPPEQLSQAYLA